MLAENAAVAAALQIGINYVAVSCAFCYQVLHAHACLHALADAITCQKH